MATTRKPAVSSAAAPVKPVVPVKPSAKLAATPAGKSAAAKVAKAKPKAKGKDKARSDKPGQAASPKAVKAVDAAKAEKADKPKKPKLVRDRFTIPKTEYAMLETLKARAARVGKPARKSELLRAGIKALAALPDLAFVSALNAVPGLKADRPAKA